MREVIGVMIGRAIRRGSVKIPFPARMAAAAGIEERGRIGQIARKAVMKRRRFAGGFPFACPINMIRARTMTAC